MPEIREAFWQNTPEQLFTRLESSPHGLSQKQAFKMRAISPKGRKSGTRLSRDLVLFASQFKSPMMLLLIGAVVISAFLGDLSDVFIILFIVITSGTLSFFQERNAGRVVEKLQSLIALKSTVLRDGVPKDINADQIVPGDIVLFNAGDMIPADCLLLESNELHANESSLTGESYPVRKAPSVKPEGAELSDRSNCLWEGSSIVSGDGKALVVRTGADTIFGAIAQSASNDIETTFEKGIKDFGYFLMRITMVLSIFILLVNLINHKSVIDSALFALALAVGMAPELLPAITTIAMSAGAKRMLQKKVIVKKLSSIQNLGEVDLLCTDKTGTITEGAINVFGIVNCEGEEDDFVKNLACWNARLESGYANPIDDALRKIAPATKDEVVKIAEVPYDFIRKRLSIAVRKNQDVLLITKGAFRETISVCSTMRLADGHIVSLAENVHNIDMQFEKYGQDGKRAIGVAFRNLSDLTVSREKESEMTFAGFILLEDPIKQGIQDTIAALKHLQVNLKIITGDNRNVAQSIAMKIGISDPIIMTGQELIKTSPEALNHLVRKTHIFAEVEPQQKERIIQALRKSHTVAYLGDGINDVSAIKAADVGITVENAVDIAREAADFVFLEKDLMVLAEGIREGRKTFANTLKYIYISTGSTFGNMFSVAAASLILPFLPMLPKQILLTNFISDFPYLMVASDNVDEEQLQRSGKWNLKLISRYMVIFGIHSSIFDIVTFLTLLYVLNVRESVFQTGWFVESALSELFILFIIRTHKSFFKSMPHKFLIFLSIFAVVMTIGLPYLPFAADIGFVPLPPEYLLAMLSIVLVYVLTADVLKVWFFRKYQTR